MRGKDAIGLRRLVVLVRGLPEGSAFGDGLKAENIRRAKAASTKQKLLNVFGGGGGIRYVARAKGP